MKNGREFWMGVGAAALVGGLALLGVLVERGRQRAHERAPTPAPERVAGADRLQGVLAELGYARTPTPPELPAVAEAAVPAPGTARAFLAQHYDERWPEIERAMEAAGAQLDAPFVCSPWDEVAPEFEQALCLLPEEVDELARGKLRWPEALSEEWLRTQYRTGRPYQLRPDDLPRIEEAVAAVNDELRAKAAQWAELIRFTVQNRWATGDVLRAPFTTLGLSHEVGFWSKSTGGHGWAVTLTLRREDYPEAAALEDEISALRRRRDETVVRYLHSTIGR